MAKKSKFIKFTEELVEVLTTPIDIEDILDSFSNGLERKFEKLDDMGFGEAMYVLGRKIRRKPVQYIGEILVSSSHPDPTKQVLDDLKRRYSIGLKQLEKGEYKVIAGKATGAPGLGRLVVYAQT